MVLVSVDRCRVVHRCCFLHRTLESRALLHAEAGEKLTLYEAATLIGVSRVRNGCLRNRLDTHQSIHRHLLRVRGSSLK